MSKNITTENSIMNKKRKKLYNGPLCPHHPAPTIINPQTILFYTYIPTYKCTHQWTNFEACLRKIISSVNTLASFISQNRKTLQNIYNYTITTIPKTVTIIH